MYGGVECVCRGVAVGHVQYKVGECSGAKGSGVEWSALGIWWMIDR